MNKQDTKSAIGRRHFLAGSLVTSLATLALGQDRDYRLGAQPQRYPDPDINCSGPTVCQIQDWQYDDSAAAHRDAVG
jgi:hypothetical protein